MAFGLPPGGMTTSAPRGAKRATAQAAPGVSATAALTAEALPLDARHELAEQRGLAAEQVSGSGNVEPDPVWRIDGDQRRAGQTPEGKGFERSRILVRRRLNHVQARHPRLSLSDRQARPQA